MAQARRQPDSSVRPRGLSPRFIAVARETSLFILGAIAVYIFIALVSYSPTDPGWSHTGNSGQVSNLGGGFGAWFADLSLHGFGYVAFLFPLLIGVAGWRNYQQRHRSDVSIQRRLVGAAGFALTIIGGCGIENLHFAEMAADMPFAPGGAVGDGTNEFLGVAFGLAGATVFLLTIFICGITWFTGLSWFRLMDQLGKGVFDAYEFLRVQCIRGLDLIAGTRARRERQGAIAEIRDKQEIQKPPRIEPHIVPPKAQPSVRHERERQSALFDDRVDVRPTLSLLEAPVAHQSGFSTESLEAMSRLLEKKLHDFNVDVRIEAVHPGPVITRFEVEPAPGVKASQITGLARDLARALSTVSVRVVENIPGKSFVGIEIPNENRETVRLVEGLSSAAYEEANTPLALVLGKDIGGAPVIADLCKMPHLLIAGTTGAGKSVCVNALILSILYKSTPDDVRLIMIDPKMLELAIYEGIPHLLAPVVTDMSEAATALRWCIVEMERRYRLMAALGVRNISGYNRKIKIAIQESNPIMNPLAEEPEQAEPLQPFHYIVVIIDELADLMMSMGKKIEELVTRIAQRARAAGIHLILATQRPSVDVITGLLKANVPTRIAFQVSSRVDSRTILDQMGAEQLLGQGDMLFLPPGSGIPMRVHGSFVADDEVHQVVDQLKQSRAPEYDDAVLDASLTAGTSSVEAVGDGPGGEQDPLYDRALQLVTETRRASISAVQRQLRVGYNRAARMIEAMEQAGAVGPLESNGRREVLAPPPPSD